MIRVIDQANQLRYRDTLERQFRFRHDIFVKERGWTAFDQDGRYEVDQYDNENTIYVVALDGEQVSLDLDGFLARVVQHELDHLDGKLYIDYLDTLDELIAVGRGSDESDEIREATGAVAARPAATPDATPDAITLYPNPSTGFVTVSASEDITSIDVILSKTF